MATWYYPLSAADAGLVAFSSNASSGGGYSMLRVHPTLGAMAQVDSGDRVASYSANSVVVSVGKWNHLAAVFTSSTARSSFSNGANKAADSASEAFPGNAPTTGIMVGSLAFYWNSPTPILPADGYISLPAIWSKALSDQEVGLLASGIHPAFIAPNNLVFLLDSLTLMNVSVYMPLQKLTDVATAPGISCSFVRPYIGAALSTRSARKPSLFPPWAPEIRRDTGNTLLRM
jgi:hypothetical protein